MSACMLFFMFWSYINILLKNLKSVYIFLKDEKVHFSIKDFLKDARSQYAVQQNPSLNMPDNLLGLLTFEIISPTFSLLAFYFRLEVCKWYSLV